ncbi:mitogen-activated protein kinase kinase kinase 12-like [Anneissia japonica]|uniref:mitogen-activated protein kinase kinase kinase 12-like n=1 Tax=Anneissia japonica TaxID=1529436 RepID=UPI0014258543|nr:mitogen-activated protein kinase kinase kinase 12-like [Anneissia japonica]
MHNIFATLCEISLVDKMAVSQVPFQIFQPQDLEIGQHCSTKPIVFQARMKSTGDTVAVKNVPNSDLRQQELEILKRLQHDHVVRLLGTIECGGVVPTELVLEYTSNGNLYEYLNTVTEFLPHYLTWCKQAVCAVAFIHEQNISHGDIKSKSYLVFGDSIKLTDFGLSKIKGDFTNLTQNLGGTILWMSPEVMDEVDNVDHFKSDIYSLGIVLWELYHRKKPYNKWKLKDIIKHVVVNKCHLEIDDECDIRELLLRSWENEPTQRPTAEEILTTLNSDQCASIIRKNKKPRPIGQRASSQVFYGYWLIPAFVIVLLGFVINSFVPISSIDIINPSIPDVQPPTPEPPTPPATQPNTTTPPIRDWQKEGLRQMKIQNKKGNKRGTV